MTEELKTLRQIGVRIRDKDKLRDEAIKWIKSLRNLGYGSLAWEMTKEQADGMEIFILQFFNLTDEDLK